MASYVSGPGSGGAHMEGQKTSAIPDAQRPKTRAPAGKRDKFGIFTSTLPRYSGPYSV